MAVRLAIILLFGCMLAPAYTASADLKADMQAGPPEKQLAFLNSPGSDWYHLDPMTVARFKSLLNQLSREYPDSPKEIANWTVKVQSVLEEEGVRESLLSLMEAVNRIAVLGPNFNGTYHDMSTAYVTLRVRGFSRQEAIEGMGDLYISVINNEPLKGRKK